MQRCSGVCAGSVNVGPYRSLAAYRAEAASMVAARPQDDARKVLHNVRYQIQLINEQWSAALSKPLITKLQGGLIDELR